MLLYNALSYREVRLASWEQETIEDVEEMLNNLPGVTSVHSRFYDLSSKYYQTIGNHASYYKDALRFLGCVDIKDLPGETRTGRCPSEARLRMLGGEGGLEAAGLNPRCLSPWEGSRAGAGREAEAVAPTLESLVSRSGEGA